MSTKSRVRRVLDIVAAKFGTVKEAIRDFLTD
jgi:hypothetical protein